MTERTSSDLLLRHLGLLAAWSVVWVVAIFALVGWIPLAGALPLSLYQLYAAASVLGWIAGNLYLLRKRSIPLAALQRRMLSLYLLGPPSALFLVRGMAPRQDQLEAPLVPLFAFLVYLVFFAVPLSFGRVPPRRPGARPDRMG
ncbi:MAG: hypothetical protein AAGN46_01060 [Acidobacteriota bacterium]